MRPSFRIAARVAGSRIASRFARGRAPRLTSPSTSRSTVTPTPVQRSQSSHVHEARAHIGEAYATAACPKCARRDRRAVIAAFMRRIWFGMGVALPATIAGLAVTTSIDANPLYGMVLAFLIVWPIAWFVRYRVAQRAMDRDVTFLSVA